MVLLIGNYSSDRQESMRRFAEMMRDGLHAAGVAAELIEPQPVFGRFRSAGAFVTKWLAYFDKFVLFPRDLRRRLKNRPALVHVCDHSNAIYAKEVSGIPVVTTCHDLLAVRGALGEKTDTPASATGKVLQDWILRGLEKATVICCVSEATLKDARRLVKVHGGKPRLELISLGLSYPYQRLSAEAAQSRIANYLGAKVNRPFVLHVGSNLRRKNREGVLRIFARCKEKWDGSLVFAGEPLCQSLTALATQLDVMDRVVEVPHATSELLEGLYNSATALLFPSTFEGFGWPIAEAQACGCPVLCVDSEPMTEVGGGAAMVRNVDDEQGFATDLLRLTDANERKHWSERSLENAKRFSATEMIQRYLELYRSLAGV